MYDNLQQRKGDQTYHIIYLENEFVRIGVAPQLGGRLLSAIDKTNNYDFVYRHHVIKPALIGLTGSWITAGIEWNIPHQELVRGAKEALALSVDPADAELPLPLRPTPRMRNARSHYLTGLGYFGLGEKDPARREFDAVLAIMPDHLGAKHSLEQF